jgi:hypothetical protein
LRDQKGGALEIRVHVIVERGNGGNLVDLSMSGSTVVTRVTAWRLAGAVYIDSVVLFPATRKGLAIEGTAVTLYILITIALGFVNSGTVDLSAVFALSFCWVPIGVLVYRVGTVGWLVLKVRRLFVRDHPVGSRIRVVFETDTFRVETNGQPSPTTRYSEFVTVTEHLGWIRIHKPGYVQAAEFPSAACAPETVAWLKQRFATVHAL